MRTNRTISGEVGELAFALQAVRSGIQISFPHGHSHQFDFITYHSEKFSRIQVKSTGYRRSQSYEINIVRKKKAYAEVDFYACYVTPENIFYIIPADQLPKSSTMVLSEKWARYKNAWHLLKGEA